MPSEQELVDTWLDRAILEFDENPLATQLIRRLSLERGDLFSRSALRHLGSAGQSGALRFIASLALRQRFFYERLSDPGPAALERAHVMFRRLQAIDAGFDVKVAKMLPDRTGTNHSTALDGARAARVLEVLDAGSSGRRLLPVLSHLVESRDPRLRARATLFVGRRIQSPAWAEKQLAQADDRVRANAIESLWGLDTPPARTLLNRFVADPVSRVAGNSLVGLHLIGEPGIVDEVNDMSEAENHDFRATAAWSMGRIGDAAFKPRLGALARDEEQIVRGNALRALINIRREEAKAAERAVEKTAEQTPSAAKPTGRPLPAKPGLGDAGADESILSRLPSPTVYVHLDELNSGENRGIGGYRR